MRQSLLSLLSILLLVTTVLACNEDWECGNPVFNDCAPQGPVCSIIEGVGISTNRVYWLERCTEGTNSTVYLMRSGTLLERVAIISENLGGLSGDAIAVKKLVSANFRAVYVLKSSRFSNSLTGVTAWYLGYLPEFEAGATRPGVPIDASFNDNDNFDSPSSFVCFGNRIVKYNTLNFTRDDPFTQLYYADCTHISYYNNTIYWATTTYDSFSQSYETKFYQGSTTCNNCSAPSPFASFASNINDFEVGNNRLYFARPNLGIESVALGSSDLSSSSFLVSSVNINGFKISPGNRVWFNNGNSIQSIYTDGTGLRTSSNITVTKSCVCSGGFTGENCQSCPNGNVQWQNGNPSCVPFDPLSGFPSRCVADYNCGNIPFTKCNPVTAKCECVTGPQGLAPSCNSCSPPFSLSWNNGIPSCSSSPNN